MYHICTRVVGLYTEDKHVSYMHTCGGIVYGGQTCIIYAHMWWDCIRRANMYHICTHVVGLHTEGKHVSYMHTYGGIAYGGQTCIIYAHMWWDCIRRTNMYHICTIEDTTKITTMKVGQSHIM